MAYELELQKVNQDWKCWKCQKPIPHGSYCLRKEENGGYNNYVKYCIACSNIEIADRIALNEQLIAKAKENAKRSIKKLKALHKKLNKMDEKINNANAVAQMRKDENGKTETQS